jgi:beta-lactamase class D
MASVSLLRRWLRHCRIFLALALATHVAAEVEDTPLPSDDVLRAALGQHDGTIVLRDVASGNERNIGEAMADQALPPCSTFKIWNTLVGLEEGILRDKDDAFWKWDGVKRDLEDWNRDLTLGESFRFSCVPAYQALARRIGKEKMEGWIRRLDYGDKNISAGLDVFWLPADGRQALLITPRRQAALLADWSAGRLPFGEDTTRKFRAIFTVRADAGDTLFGKTGSGMGANGKYKLGWFVGVFESPRGKIAFACALRGDAVSGRDARAVIEKIFPAVPR